MFFSKWAFNAPRKSSRCSGDKSFLLLIMFARFRRSHSLRFPRFLSVTPLRSATSGFFSACLCVLINSQVPRRSECTRQYVLACRQANMGVSHFSPSARDWQENLGRLLHKRCLLLQRKHQISVALCLRRERSKFPASYTRSRQSRVRILFHAFQAQRNPAKICCGHVGDSHPSERVSYLTISACQECETRAEKTALSDSVPNWNSYQFHDSLVYNNSRKKTSSSQSIPAILQ